MVERRTIHRGRRIYTFFLEPMRILSLGHSLDKVTAPAAVLPIPPLRGIHPLPFGLPPFSKGALA